MIRHLLAALIIVIMVHTGVPADERKPADPSKSQSAPQNQNVRLVKPGSYTFPQASGSMQKGGNLPANLVPPGSYSFPRCTSPASPQGSSGSSGWTDYYRRHNIAVPANFNDSMCVPGPCIVTGNASRRNSSIPFLDGNGISIPFETLLNIPWTLIDTVQNGNSLRNGWGPSIFLQNSSPYSNLYQNGTYYDTYYQNFRTPAAPFSP